jgi:CHAT domain-containing protein/tetratricopeptide (TPR) repeat protein
MYMSLANCRWLYLAPVCSLIFIVHPFAAPNFPAQSQSGEKAAIRNLQELVSALASVKTGEERRALLEAKSDLVTAELAQALSAKGRSLNTQGRYKEAFDMLGMAVVVGKQVNDKKGTAVALREIGNAHRLQGDYQQALERLQESLKIAEEIGDKHGIAGALNDIGAAHAAQWDYAQALERFQKSLEIRESLGDQREIAATLRSIGLIHNFQENHSQAQESLQKSLEITERLGDKKETAYTLNSIGTLHWAQGNYAQALGYFQRSLEIREEIGDKRTIAGSLNNIGIIHRLQGNYRQALECYQKSLKIREEIGSKQAIAEALNNIGNVHTSKGDNGMALEFYQKSLKLKEETGQKKGIAATLNNIGTIHLAQGDYKQALEYFQRSLEIREEIGDKQWVVETLGNIAKVHLLQGAYTQAVEIVDRLSPIAEQIGLPGEFWEALSTMGRARRALNRPDLARGAFDQAIMIIERLRAQVAGSEQDSQRFFEDKLEPYHQMVQLLIDQNEPREAFAYAERAKARALLDTLRTGGGDINKAMTSDEREHERKLKAEITSLNTRIYREKLRDKPDSSRLAQLTALLEKARLDYEVFNVNLYAAHPELKIYRGQMRPITLDQAAGLIPDADTAVLEYVVTEDKTYLFTLTSPHQPGKTAPVSMTAPTLNVYKIDVKLKDLAEQVGQFHRKLANRDYEFRQLAGDLYNLLLAPAQAALQGRANLIIVPDGPLWNLSFQALRPSPRRFLIEDAAVSYAPSLTALSAMTRPQRAGSNGSARLLALANPLISGQTARAINSVFMDERLAPLPEAERQAKLLASLYGPARSKIYIGPQAREDRVKTEATDYRILHLAAHGILNDKNPMYSQVVLSQGDAKTGEDGMLEAWEITKLNLKTDLVVLSACETARGRVGNGEGMIGLTWSFFVAGVPSIVASQWRVESVSASELMVEFHRSLNLRKSKAEALRQASLKLLRSKSYKHPLYWAGFIVVGDGR